MATASLHRLVRQLQHSAKATGLGELPDQDLLDRLLAGDTSAFEALVWRHGGLVLSACRRVLTDEADAEDAFQATFLALLQGARSIRRRNEVGAWLCGVAHRVAVDALADALRRRQRERRAARTEAAPAAPDLSWREACAALHGELDRLPDKYRLPLVLCYLRGLSRDEAARQLGWTVQSLKGRLERGRLLLRDRLARRGITLSAGLLAALGDSAAASTVPSRLVQVTLHAATGGRRSAAVAALVEGATHAMFRSQVPVIASLLLVTGLLVGVVALRQLPTRAAVVADPAPGPEVELKWKFTEGKLFYQTMTTTTTQNMTVTGTKVEQKQEQTFFFEWKPIKIAKDKVTLTQKIIGLKMNNKFFDALKDNSFTITIDTKEMKVTSIEGHEKFINKLIETNPQMKPLLEKFLGKEALLDMQSTTMFTALPGKKVKKNDTWRRKSLLDMGSIGRYETSYTYTYEGPAKNKSHKIDLKIDLKYSPPDANTVANLPFKIKDAKLEAKDSTGTIVYDPKTGWIKSSEMKLKLTGTLTLGIGQQSTAVELTQEQTTKILTSADNPIKK
ncbi:MAG: RNA polymerase sigma factor [Planctomycetes bacterium]|nr:RNA polymerase sigma factor [Planctomycetota bacterium]